MISSTPVCQHCKKTENVSIYAHSTLKDGTKRPRYMCRKCNTERTRLYRQKNMKRIYAITRRYDAAHPERKRAWGKCAKMPPAPCVVCGEPKTDKHHDDPLKPFEIIYLCRLHHKEVHRGLDSLAIV